MDVTLHIRYLRLEGHGRKLKDYFQGVFPILLCNVELSVTLHKNMTIV